MNKIDVEYLKRIVDATAAGNPAYVTADVGKPMLDAGLIEVETAVTNPSDSTQVLCRSTAAAAGFLASQASNGGQEAAKPNYQIITGAVLPDPKKRGAVTGGGAPTKYPFADLPVGGTFFSANTEHAKGDAVKALGSTVSAQNDKYSKPKMENGVVVTKTVTRAVRDKVSKKAQIGPDGKKVTETVTLPVKEYERKFTIRPVEAGKTYGNWTAPADGALVGRIQ